MHAIGCSSVLAGAHQVVIASSSSLILCAFYAFLVDDGHLVEVILG